MNISVKQILAKMEQELQSALQADEKQVRDHLLVIRSLCELVIQDQPTSRPVQSDKVISTPTHSLQNQPKKNVELDDEANGDSLFDF